jgi:hypothetical protein
MFTAIVDDWSVRRLFVSAFMAEIVAIILLLSAEFLLAALVCFVAVPLGVLFWIRFVQRSRSSL